MFLRSATCFAYVNFDLIGDEGFSPILIGGVSVHAPQQYRLLSSTSIRGIQNLEGPNGLEIAPLDQHNATEAWLKQTSP